METEKAACDSSVPETGMESMGQMWKAVRSTVQMQHHQIVWQSCSEGLGHTTSTMQIKPLYISSHRACKTQIRHDTNLIRSTMPLHLSSVRQSSVCLRLRLCSPKKCPLLPVSLLQASNYPHVIRQLDDRAYNSNPSSQSPFLIPLSVAILMLVNCSICCLSQLSEGDNARITLQGLVRGGVGLGAQVGSGGARRREVSGEHRLQERTEHDLRTTIMG